MLFAFLGIIGTGSLWMVNQGQWQLAVFFYIVAAIGLMSGNIFYDSLLPSIASKDKIDYTSSLGFALGYIGGGLLFLVNVLMYLKPSMFGSCITPCQRSNASCTLSTGVLSIYGIT